MSLQIHKLLDDIEIKTRVVVTKNDLISDTLLTWQNGKLPDEYFRRILQDYLDEMELLNE
jgi:hypothetical protein